MGCICENCEVYKSIESGRVAFCLRMARSFSDLSVKITECINAPRKEGYTKEEASELLRQCGILDESGDVVEAYKDIIVKKDVEDA